MRRIKLWLFLLVVVLVAVAAWGIWQRRSNVSALAMDADQAAIPEVSVVSPRHGPPSRELTLPGDVHAWYQAPIFAQVTGYVQAWNEDYGAQVRAGELLATVATPRLDEQVAEARAQLEVAQANYELARVTAGRYQKLSGTQAVAEQDVDVKVATARAQKAEVDAAQAHLGALEAQERFKRIVAPFDGVVTARLTDVGDYVNANGGDAGVQRQELFSVADIHKLRVFVSVPQDYSAFLARGVTATLAMPQFPDRTFEATVLTNAHAVNEQSRTVLTELVVDNADHLILPGAFTEVRFHVPTDRTILIVPEQALLFRSRGMEVAIVRADGHVHLQPVHLGLNFGTTVQVTSGLTPSDRLIANPSLGLIEGEQVHVANVPPQNTNDENESSEAPSSDQ